MSSSPEFALSESGGVQLQVLTTLANMGWRYRTRTEVDEMRGGRRSAVVLTPLAHEALAAINSIDQDGADHPFTQQAIEEGLSRLRDLRFDGLLRTNELATDYIQLGTAVPQTIKGLTRERQLRFVAWGVDECQRNSFDMTAEYVVEGRNDTIRCDIVLFVNGIPWAVIEVKRSGEKATQGISQSIRNQGQSEGAAQLFITTQLLITGNPSEPRYGTVGTPAKFWSAWREPAHRGMTDAEIADLVNAAPPADVMATILSDFASQAGRHDALREAGHRWVTELDKAIVGLCRPDRLLDLARRFTLFDKGVKKVARYQQVSAVYRILDRVEERDEAGRRKGGVIWHTQGSGKSLTMVMLARALAFHLKDASPRIVIVTDRRDLDRQIKKTFAATGFEPAQARTGEHLMKLIEDGAPLVTTLVNKFRSGVRKRALASDSRDIFVLVDESHRSQYGNDDSMHEDMRRVLPNACYIGFTGTPLFKDKARNTFLKFGELIDSYPIARAVKDEAVVPLLYEGRVVAETLDATALDAWFERTSEGLTLEQRAELKRRMSAPGVIQTVDARLKAIAWDIRQHYLQGFKGTGLKGQVVAPDKASAVALKALFDTLNEGQAEQVTAEVIISAPDKREGHDEVGIAPKKEVKRFWAEMMARFKNEDDYTESIVRDFDSPESPELLIVVSKLLTGFDVPRNTVLYLTRVIKEHDLLQAIARVNRVFDDEEAPPKPFGYIVDYCGILGELNGALASYDALTGFDDADINGALFAIRTEAERLPGLHSELLDLFAGVGNRYDQEAYAQALADEALRDLFHRKLSAFASTLNVALSSRQFVETTPRDRLDRWKADLKRFELLRQDVRRRYADTIDWAQYEGRVRKLLAEHITAHRVDTVVDPFNIFDEGAIEEQLSGGRSAASVADEITSQISRTITENWDEDPAFYEAFSKLVQSTIDSFRQKRIGEREYLKKARALKDQAHARAESKEVPEKVRGNGHAVAFWGVIAKELGEVSPEAAKHAPSIALALLEIVESHRRVGWQDDRDQQNRMRAAADDFFFDTAPGEFGLSLDPERIDGMVDQILTIARERLPK
jgi:type I restriction enzyme R subunit